MRGGRAIRRLGGSLLAALGLGAGAAAQQAAAPDLNRLALDWAHGDFRSPLVCEIDGAARRGFRRVSIAVAPPTGEQPVARLRFFDLEVPDGTRCGTETVRDVPNVVGTLALVHRGRSRPDTAARDFTSALRREGGFEYAIASGSLELTPTHDSAAARAVDFRGGRAWLGEVKRGSDAWRRLAEYPAPRKRVLRLDAPDGSVVELDLVDLAPP